jgi:L-threonylcarbamoyladenylate synthase
MLPASCLVCRPDSSFMNSDLHPDADPIRAAAALLEEGKLVAFPTETVYGLGADAENPDAVRAIFAAKGRPADHPLIVHVARNADLQHWAREVPLQARQLIDAFWPGPLTLILPRAPQVPALVAGGQDSIGLRCPSHPVAQALLAAFKHGQGGIAGPSANRFGHVSPTTAQHVIDEFGLPGVSSDSPLACVLDGGQSDVGIESTIIDLSRLPTHGAVLLRPGRISAAQIAEVLGDMPAMPDRAAPRVSGSLDAHYAPSTPLALIATEQLPDLMQRLSARGRRFALMYYTQDATNSQAAVRLPLSADPQAYAHALYATLRMLDMKACELILVEQPPQDERWQGVNDRLRRAAFDSAGVLERLL